MRTTDIYNLQKTKDEREKHHCKQGYHENDIKRSLELIENALDGGIYLVTLYH